MSYENWNSKKETIKSLELNEGDVELMKTLNDIKSMQQELIQFDLEERRDFVLSDMDAQKCLDEALDDRRFWNEQFKNMPPQNNSYHETSEDKVRRQKILDTLLGKIPKNLHHLIVDLAKEGVTPLDILGRVDKVVNEELKEKSIYRMQDIMNINERIAEFSFTTDQAGSDSRHLDDSNYDSIYYMFPLSNGTYMSQRIKRSVIKDGLRNAVQPFAASTLFIDDKSGIEGAEVKPGIYSSSDVSLKPGIGLRLFDYFTRDSISGNFDNLKIPDIFSSQGDSTIVKKNTDEAFDQVHGGTEVNKINYKK